MFCIKQSLSSEQKDELILFEDLFREPKEESTYHKTLILKRDSIVDYTLTKKEEGFVFLVSAEKCFLKLEYFP